MLTGWRTIITMILGILYAVASMLGVVVAEDERTAISVGVLAVAGLILRLVTHTSPGQSQ